MAGWIREQETASAIITPKLPSNKVAKAKSRSEPRRDSKGDMIQSSLKNHFIIDRSKQEALSAWKDRSGGNSSSRSEFASIQMGRERDDTPIIEDDPLNRKRKAAPSIDEETSPIKKKERLGKITSNESPSLFGSPPQSSLTARPRLRLRAQPTTPTHKRGRKNIGVGGRTQPAISPKKRKSLINDSAWETAMQQHRSWERSSSSPLRDINNLPVSPKKTPEKILERSVKAPQTDTKRTPSRLRHGYSMLAFDEENYLKLQSSDAEEEEEEEQENDGLISAECSSPSAERQERAVLHSGLAYKRSPRSNKKVYAEETQRILDSPLCASIEEGELPSTFDLHGKLAIQSEANLLH
jgi:hypothetical protein